MHRETRAAVLRGRVTGQPGEGVVLLQHKPIEQADKLLPQPPSIQVIKIQCEITCNPWPKVYNVLPKKKVQSNVPASLSCVENISVSYLERIHSLLCFVVVVVVMMIIFANLWPVLRNING